MNGFQVERDVAMEMRDGVRLRADIWRPMVSRPVSAILFRTPYDRRAFNADFLRPQDAAAAGFAAVVQDTRGRFSSEGDWKPLMWEQEGDDGHDSVEWIARQPWCSGAVGMSGPSYLGITQLVTAARRPPHLRAIAPAIASVAEGEQVEMGGGFRLDHILSWVAFMALDWMQRRQASGDPLPDAAVAEVSRAAQNPRGLMDHRPLRDIALFRLPGFPITFDDLANPANAARILPEIADIPTLHVGGWYDVFAQSTVEMFRRQRLLGRDDAHLVMGCWSHGGTLPSQHGEVNFGLAASGAGARIAERHISFFRRYLDGADVAIPPARYFLANAGEWRDAPAWPPAGTVTVEIPLSGPGERIYRYDPENPTPTVGGRTLGLGGLAMGPVDQRRLNGRGDLLRYATLPVPADLDLIGPVDATLTFSSSAIDTDVVCRLLDITPDGTMLPVTDGTLRLRHREGFDREVPLVPGQPTMLAIAMGNIAWRLRTGHRLGLQVQSANYPHLDPNLNDMSPLGSGTAGIVAHNRVHDGEGASAIRITATRPPPDPLTLRPEPASR
ncbi:CocE/NonD family hydrolase [Niveispirillum sp.]|uniref:CocE/NonD family hydrolase n=1 Tax=Niveispirillum sp. TaxID=1917217 RepID=UPI001B3D143D|nr:CocE/NonD family hydrolase [Niveispirillum sp.]MBP7338519.1 CocE/NonD family hydrolase [Niveispirillum sp.]